MRSYAARSRVPLPVLAALVALVAVAPVGLALSETKPVPQAGAPLLADIARDAGCVLSEFDADPHSNPPVSGRVDERITARDGSYAGRRSPSALASMHSLAATAYLTLMTCPRVDTHTLGALRAFRERRSAFQQLF